MLTIPMAGMDMAEAKAKYGNKVCIYGNVSCAFSLVSDKVWERGRKQRK